MYFFLSKHLTIIPVWPIHHFWHAIDGKNGFHEYENWSHTQNLNRLYIITEGFCDTNGHTLTHWSWVRHVCVRKLSILSSDNGWNIGYWTLRNKLQWNLSQNSNIFIKENAFENVVCKLAFILSWPQCVNPLDWNLRVVLMPTLLLMVAPKDCHNEMYKVGITTKRYYYQKIFLGKMWFKVIKIIYQLHRVTFKFSKIYKTTICY